MRQELGDREAGLMPLLEPGDRRPLGEHNVFLLGNRKEDLLRLYYSHHALLNAILTDTRVKRTEGQ